MKVSNHDAISADDGEWESIELDLNSHFPSTTPESKYHLPLIVYADGECYTTHEETRDRGRFIPHGIIAGRIHAYVRVMFGGLPCYQNLDILRFLFHCHTAVRHAVAYRKRGALAAVEVDLRRTDPDDIIAVVRTLTSAGK